MKGGKTGEKKDIEQEEDICCMLHAQLSVVFKLTSNSIPLSRSLIKISNSIGPILENTTCDQLPHGFKSIHHHSLGSAIKPFF